MNVTVEVVGEGSHDLEVEDATYADLLAEVDLSPHEVSVMVDGRPVPEDQPVEADHVKVLRLIKGGSDERRTDMADPDEVGAGPIPADDSGTDQPTELDRERGTAPERAADRERRSLNVSQLDFELPNAGTGPDPLSLSALADDPGNDAVVLLFQRDHRSRSCREQLQTVADRYSEFRVRDAMVVSVLPEPKETAEKWQKKFHLPFPLVADEEKTVAAAYGQPTRWGKLGKRFDVLGRLPQTAILDARDGDLRLFAVHRGDGASDWPSVDDVLAMVDRLLADER